MANVMTAETELEQDVLRSLRLLPEERRAQLHDFARFLLEQERKPKEPSGPRTSYMGALAHLNIDLTEKDFAEMKREMWANFPREHFYDDVLSDSSENDEQAAASIASGERAGD